MEKVTWVNGGWWGKGYLVSKGKKTCKIKDKDGKISTHPVERVFRGHPDSYEELPWMMDHYPL